MSFGNTEELDRFVCEYPHIEMLELLIPDLNGILRCKRIHRREWQALYQGSFRVPGTIPFLGILGDMYDCSDRLAISGDPDQVVRPIADTLKPVPWFDTQLAQVLVGFADKDGGYAWMDPRSPLLSVLDRYRQHAWQPVVATELEFYLLAASGGSAPKPLRGRITGTDRMQHGIQYCMQDDLMDCNTFLDDVHRACDLHGIPLTAIHSEFSPGQWEINTHHNPDAVAACNESLLLRRIVKATARKHGIAATFMAKPFEAIAGNGLHIHASVYDQQGGNIFASSARADPPTLTPALRHGVGGLAATMNEAMAIFAPNANSYRRFKAGAFAPCDPSWGYDHREVALRIPVSTEENRRIEHRVAGADANPYLVTAAVLAGIHHGVTGEIDPGPPKQRESDLSRVPVTLPNRWDAALDNFRRSELLPEYLGARFSSMFVQTRQGECDDFHSRIADLDYLFYLRAI